MSTFFQIGETYAHQPALDSAMYVEFTVASRTSNTLKTTCGKTLLIFERNGIECAKPFGRGFAGPIMRSTK